MLANPEFSEQLADAIADICEEIKEEQRDEAGAKKPLTQVKRARSLLAAIEIARASDDTIDDIRSELGQLIALAEGLLEQTEKTERSPI
jgi:hypothetical protein